MNNRIQQLIAQSQILDYYTPGENFPIMKVDPEKLAELIVQECMKVSMKSVGPDAEYEAWYLIKEHFGVKE